jgi:hypothetical protein
MSKMTKSPTRPVAKRTRRTREQATDRVKTAVILSADTYQRLSACSARERLTHSQILEALLSEMLSSYVVSCHAGRSIWDLTGQKNPAANTDRREADDSVNADAA